MGTIKEVYESYKKVNADKVFSEAVFDTSNEANELNRKQLKAGELSNGELLPYYSTVSQDLFGKDNIRIQLFDSGEFQKALDTYPTKNGAIVSTSLDEKADMLAERYGSDIFGLTEKNRINYVEILQNKMIEIIKKIIK